MFWMVVAVFGVALLRVFVPNDGFDEVRTGEQPLEVAAGDDGVWVLNYADHSVSLIDPDTQEERFETELGVDVAPALSANDDGAWVILDAGTTIGRVDPDSQEVAERVELGDVFDEGTKAQDLAAGPDFVWVTSGEGGQMVRLDTSSGELGEVVDVEGSVVQPQVLGESLWVYESDGITEYDSGSGDELNKIDTHQYRVHDFAATEDDVFIIADVDAFEETGVVYQLNPEDGTSDGQRRIQDSTPSRITAADGQVFVTGSGGFLTELAPARDTSDPEGAAAMRIVATEQVTVSTKDLRDLVVHDGVIWIADGTNGVVHQPIDDIEGDAPTETTTL